MDRYAIIDATIAEMERLRAWKETVRDIYDACWFDHPTLMQIIEMIEEHHPGYFNTPPGARYWPDDALRALALSPTDELVALRARVAKLEAVLKEARPLICGCDVSNDYIAGVRDRLDAALKDAPQ